MYFANLVFECIWSHTRCHFPQPSNSSTPDLFSSSIWGVACLLLQSSTVTHTSASSARTRNDVLRSAACGRPFSGSVLWVGLQSQWEKGYRWRCSHGINRFASSLILPYFFPLVIIANERSDNRNPLFGRMWECMRGCAGAKCENRLLLRNRTKQKCHRFACRALVGVGALECIRLYHAVPI